ncbi:MAG: ABC transporter ATP-binding protein [Ktedonobacteraceae bacterium]|nr:ABC transporter ATP-binding protein [Ktedonobacteraceae bacterium]
MQKTESGNAIIKIQNVSRRYHKFYALNDLTLEIPQGSIYGFIGPNGAGKSTLLRILAALLSPTNGEVWFGNDEVSQHPSSIHRKVGYMPDFFGVYPDLTTIEYLEFYAGIYKIPRKKSRRIITDLLELVDLSSKHDELVETLSRGMKQRLCLARALIHDPDILLLDEPASGLDPRGRVELRELVHSLQGIGKTVIISSHILPELAEMCTDIALLQEGRLVAAGDVEKIVQRFSTSHLLEIRILEAERIPAALELLKKQPGMNNVTSSSENMLLAEFNGNEQALPQIMADLITQGVPITSFTPRTNSGYLEDIFMSITEGSSPS